MEVEVEPAVDERLGGREQDVAGSAELDEQVALPDEAGRERRGDVVGAARDDRRARPGSPVAAAAAGRDLPDDLVGAADRRQERRVEADRGAAMSGAQPPVSRS